MGEPWRIYPYGVLLLCSLLQYMVGGAPVAKRYKLRSAYRERHGAYARQDDRREQLIDRNAAAIQREYELEIKKIKTELDECKSRAEAAEREVMQLRSNRDYWKNYANTLADEREKLIDFNNKICEAVERMDKKIEEIKIANGGG